MSIQLNNVSYIYGKDTVYQTLALNDINLDIKDGEIVSIIGHTGSGKSTLMQLLNGLLKPTQGTVKINSIQTDIDKKALNNLRKSIGLVFQYPEYQLFEETVYNDIAFGPKNLGLSDDEVDKAVKDSMEIIGLNYDEFNDKSPFDLSGGQKRKVAIAGVLAMKPKILLLDEPTAGLDPAARDELIEILKKIYAVNNITLIFISHSMEDVLSLAQRIIVLDKGSIILDGKKEEVFSNVELLEKAGLDIPQNVKILFNLIQNGWITDKFLFDTSELKNFILENIKC